MLYMLMSATSTYHRRHGDSVDRHRRASYTLTGIACAVSPTSSPTSSPTATPAPTALTVIFVSFVTEKTKANVASALVPVCAEAAILVVVASYVHLAMPPVTAPGVHVPIGGAVQHVETVPSYALHMAEAIVFEASHSLSSMPRNATAPATVVTANTALNE